MRVTPLSRMRPKRQGLQRHFVSREQQAMESFKFQYRSITGLSKWLKTLLALGVVMAVVAILSSLLQAGLLSQGPAGFTEAEAEANDSREAIVGLLQTGLYLITMIVFGVWIVRANKNVRALGATDLRITPGWALGYFFVPVICLWRPYQAMKDLWRASKDPENWNSVECGSILPVWWTLWIVANFLGQISIRVMLSAQTVQDMETATYVLIFAQVWDIPLCLVARSLVNQISLYQREHEPCDSFL